MAAAALDFGAILAPLPRGAWVAISREHKTVIAYGSDMDDVLAEAKLKGDEDPLVIRVPERNTTLFL